MKKGQAGILYLTIAPETGVVHPINKYRIIMKVRQNPTNLKSIFALFLLKKRHKIPKRNSVIFSSELSSIIADLLSQIKGRKVVLVNADGIIFTNSIGLLFSRFK